MSGGIGAQTMMSGGIGAQTMMSGGIGAQTMMSYMNTWQFRIGHKNFQETIVYITWKLDSKMSKP
jgi:hypothetical protein